MRKTGVPGIICLAALAAAVLPASCTKHDVEKEDGSSATAQSQTKSTSDTLAIAPFTEKDKIAALLGAVEKSKATFIRNDQEYPASAARQLMEYKLKKTGDQIKTAQDFIDQLATRSSTTGRVYQIRLPDGRTTESAFWLRAHLAEIERRGR